ncbi:MAG: HPP family protein, partial [Synergistaceae bacterium]|nr:HPP family protein [Synergistaceae bacterium]
SNAWRITDDIGTVYSVTGTSGSGNGVTLTVFPALRKGALLCVAIAIALMDVTDTMHPPAAATSLIALASGQGPGFILMPAASGACVIASAAFIAKRLSGNGREKN